jgi:hypothetical protein
MEYKNIIFLKDYNDEKIDAILYTNENAETINDAIIKAKNEYYELEEQNKIPVGINCEYEYIRFCLQDKYNIEFLETWGAQEVYY